MRRKLSITLERASATGQRVVTYWLDDAGVEFEEQNNGVLVIDDGEKGTFIRRFNPNAWQSYTLEVVDD
jgi:hypothetical protein